MKLFRRKMSRRNRNLITGLLIGAASLAFVVYLLEIPGAELLRLFGGTLAMLLVIIALAVLAIVLFKGIGRLLRKFH